MQYGIGKKKKGKHVLSILRYSDRYILDQKIKKPQENIGI